MVQWWVRSPFKKCGSSSIQARCHMWLEFVVGSRLSLRVFLRVLWFSSTEIPTLLLLVNISDLPFWLNILPVFETLPSLKADNVSLV